MSAHGPAGRRSEDEAGPGRPEVLPGDQEPWRSRPSLTVWSYDSPRAAAAGTLRFAELVRGGSVVAIDAVTAMWVPGSHRPWIGQLRQAGPSGAAGAAGAGGAVLVGLARLLLQPEQGDDELPRVADALAGTGVDAEFLREARSLMSAPRSTLMVLSTGVDLDVLRPVVERGLARGDVVLLHALLRGDALDVFREALDQTGLREKADSLGDPAGLAFEMTARYEHMTTPSTPDVPSENDEPMFDEVVDELGFNPAHPEEPAVDVTEADPDNPTSPAT